jgi:hypothetical protein
MTNSHSPFASTIRYAPVALAVLVLAIWPLTTARADSPFDDPAFRPPQGGVVDGARSPAPALAPALPAGYTEIPPPSSIAGTPARGPFFQQGTPTDPNNPLDWLTLGYNPGKWLLDSVLGAISGIILSVAGIFQSLAVWAFPHASASSNAAITATTASSSSYISDGIVFSTPLAYTLTWGGSGAGGIRWVHNIVRLATIAIMTVVFTFRCIRLIASHSRQEIVELAFAFIGGVLITQFSLGVCELMINVANAIGAVIVNGYTFWDGAMLFPAAADPLTATALSLTFALVTLAYWFLLALLVFKAIGRIVLVNLLIIVSPLAGLGILSGGWNYASIWFFRLVELLVTPIAWAIVLGFLRNLIGSFQLGDNLFLAYLMSCYVLFITPKAPQVLGLAARDAWNRHGAAITMVVTRAVMSGA